MTTPRWLTVPDGETAASWLKTLAIVGIAIAGSAALIAGTLYQTFRNNDAVVGGLLAMAGFCVAPLTGASIGVGIATGTAKLQQVRAARASQALSAPPDSEPPTT